LPLHPYKNVCIRFDTSVNRLQTFLYGCNGKCGQLRTYMRLFLHVGRTVVRKNALCGFSRAKELRTKEI